MNFKRTNSTLTNLQRNRDITLYDVIGLFQDICEDLEEEKDKTIDELELGDSKKAVGRLLWVGQEITNVLKSNKKMLIDPDRAVKIEKQGEKLALEVSVLEAAEKDLKRWTENEEELIKIQKKRESLNDKLTELKEQSDFLEKECVRLKFENAQYEAVTIPELTAKKIKYQKKNDDLSKLYTEKNKEEITLRNTHDSLENSLNKMKMACGDLEKEISIKTSKFQQLQKQKGNLEADLALLNGRLEMLGEEEKSLIRRINELQINLDNRDTKILKRKYEEKKAEYQKAEDEYKELTDKECGLDTRLADLKNDILTIQKKIQEKGKSISALSKEKEDQKKNLDTYTAQAEELEMWFKGIECKDCMDRIKKIQRRAENLRDAQKSLLQDLDDKLYLADDTAMEKAKKIRDYLEETLKAHEDGIRELQREYVEINKIMYIEGESFL